MSIIDRSRNSCGGSRIESIRRHLFVTVDATHPESVYMEDGDAVDTVLAKSISFVDGGEKRLMSSEADSIERWREPLDEVREKHRMLPAGSMANA